MNNKLSYSEFILDAQSMQDKRKIESDRNTVRDQLIQNHVAKHGLVELKCDYYGMDSYYYDKLTKVMYKVDRICNWNENPNPVFEISHDLHILKLNSLI